MMRLQIIFVTALIALFLASASLHAQQAHGTDETPSRDTNQSIYKPGPAVVAPRTTAIYAKPGMTLNPVAIDFDGQGNIYIAEGWRMGKGAAAIVHGPMVQSNSLPLDLQRTTIEQRAEHIESLIKGGYFEREYFTGRADLLRLVKDTNGDGTADQSSIFAGGFNDKLDGVASGVLYHDGKVLFACVPHLWQLEDKDGDGDADKDTPNERTSLFYGFGLRWGYGGHDLHGLIKGPDGRIYFTMGDRGYNIQTQEGERLVGTDIGSVFRMWPDGSGLEIFATGLRNPQELAFDNYGNLFTGDNNCDAGDLARFCYIPEGSDAGWRQDVQSMDTRGVWMREHMWEPRFEKNDPAQPAWIMPPLANVGRGPSGIAHYPGTGDAFPQNGSFLMCDYPAGVRHVLLKPDGASFKVVEDSQLPTESVSISDVAWGYDGRLYLADWGGGWGPNDKHGHLKVMVNEKAHAKQAEVIAEVKGLFAQGFEPLSDDTLIELLGHEDQRVRIEAQWEIASRNHSIFEKLWAVFGDETASELTRLHAVWAIGMICHQDLDGGYDYADFTLRLALNDKSPVVRAQALKTLGDLAKRLSDYGALYAPNLLIVEESLEFQPPIVQHHSAIALGKTGVTRHIPPLIDLLESNNNKDVVLRHAASYGLSLIGDAEAIHRVTKDRGPAARLGAVLALRHLKSPRLSEFIEDDDLQIAAEAVRAIYDQKIDEHLPTLAALADSLAPDRMIEPIMRRVIEANVRLADADSADRLAKIAANADAPEQWRALALQELTNWSAQRNREDVWGWWMPRPTQSMAHASAAMKTHLPAIKATATGDVLTQARVFELTHILKAGPELLTALARNTDEPEAVRMAGMQMLRGQAAGQAVALAEELLAEPTSSPSFRTALRSLILPLNRAAAVRAYLHAFEHGTIPEQQEAIHELAVVRSGEAMQFMVDLGEQLNRGELPPELRLDAHHVLTKYRNHRPEARQSAMQYAQQNTRPGEGPFIQEASLVGGSPDRGKDIFLNNTTAQCQRCHAADGSDSVGPGLNGIAAVHDAAYFYQALVHPSEAIAKGFANSVVRLKDGRVLSGRILRDQSTPSELVLTNADGVVTSVPRDQLQGQPIVSEQSQMPTMTDKLTPMELRDVIAYLRTLSDNPSPAYRISSANASGTQLVKAAAGMPHAIWLPAILLGITAALVALLLLTIFSSRLQKA
jgi:quinoprotein glucose dehydrogenase